MALRAAGWFVLVTAGCVGAIGEPPPAGEASAHLACDLGGQLDPGPTHLRRITNDEYRRTVSGLFGDGLTDVTIDFPPDSIKSGYTNNSETIPISQLHVERYQEAAERLAFEVVSDPARRVGVVGCDSSGGACLTSFVETFGRRAFRRPLSAEEIASLVALTPAASDDPDPNAAARLVIEAVLQSASFLFRVERGQPDPLRADRNKLTGFEVATRLAFLLLGRGPDDVLLETAAAGGLDSADGVQAAAEALLAAGLAAPAVHRFTSEWLQQPLLATVERDPAEYPLYDEELRASMAEETRRFLEHVLWDEGDMLDLLDAPFSFIDARLAALYGVEPPASGEWSERALPQRAGILTHASVLTITAKNEAATVIRRGKYVRDVLLCNPPPRPPKDVPPLVADDDAPVTEQLGQHLTDPVCRSCHEKMDPIGFGFARYDAIGAYRDTLPGGAVIEQHGQVIGLEEPDFEGPLGLASLLRASPQVPACMVTQVFRYAFGRGEREADQCTMDGLGAAFEESSHSFRALLVAFVRSDAFRYRSRVDAGDFF